jgi:hypothetical protein
MALTSGDRHLKYYLKTEGIKLIVKFDIGRPIYIRILENATTAFRGG